ncbi:MAG: hypothetical protein HUJ27_12935 [Rhodobacteraceae bacterium]|nr:hypothetical protein [Paracoccaceae bacterium]
MPLDRLVLILVSVIAAAGVTIWAGAALLGSFNLDPAFGLAVLSIIALVGYILVRVIMDRVGSREDDHYDRMDH